MSGADQPLSKACNIGPRASSPDARALLPGAILAVALAGAAPGGVRAADEVCEDAAFARLCPQRCGALCRSDRAFYLAHTEFCLSSPAFNADRPDDDPRCAASSTGKDGIPPRNATEPKAALSLPDCLAAARDGSQAPTERLALLSEDTTVTRSLRAVLDGMPTCAPDLATLERMRTCLEADATAVAAVSTSRPITDYGALDKPAELCRVSFQTLRRDYAAATELEQRLTATREALAELSDCKDAYRDWATERVQGAQAAGLVQAWIEGQVQQLEATTEAIAALLGRVESLKKSVEHALEHIRVGLVVCPGAVVEGAPRLGTPEHGGAGPASETRY